MTEINDNKIIILVKVKLTCNNIVELNSTLN